MRIKQTYIAAEHLSTVCADAAATAAAADAADAAAAISLRELNRCCHHAPVLRQLSCHARSADLLIIACVEERTSRNSRTPTETV